MDGERRKPSNAVLRRVVLAGYGMEFEIGRLLEKEPGYTLTEKDCEELTLRQQAWDAKVDRLRQETTVKEVAMPVAARGG